MCNFNKQNEDTKLLIHLFMQKSSETIGGTNFLLGLVEALRGVKPNPLIESKCKIGSAHVTITWNKVVFKDKVDLLSEVLLAHKSAENPNFNLLEIENQKQKKKVLNMIKALAPVDFIVKPKQRSEGGGFEFKIFDKLDFENEHVTINPVFVALFFCSVDYTKRALKYDAES